MGKYMRKSKTSGGGEVALMDVVSSSHSSSLGVRTRAKTLALQRLQSSQSPPPPPPAAASSYIQLRSRRLVKPAVAAGSEPPKRSKNSFPNPNSRCNSSLVPVNDLNSGGGSPRDDCSKLGVEEGVKIKKKKKKSKNEKDNSGDLRIEEASFGENFMEFDVKERTTRESTPCSLIRDPDTIRTPGSSTRPTTSADDANRRVRNSMQRHIPTSREMDEFFAMTEEKQQKQFMDKYNFDPVNEKPLPGRFEWVKVDEKKC